MYATVIRAISQVKKASVSKRQAVKMLVRLIICFIFSYSTPSDKFKPFIMRKFLLLFAATGLLISCNNDKKKDNGAAMSGEKATAENISPAGLKQTPLQIASRPYEKLLGSYVGPFVANKITMLIITVAGDFLFPD